MPDQVLKEFITQYIDSQREYSAINFIWQGGEPTLLGLDFFRKVLSFQAEYCPPETRIVNHLQTNGILIDQNWACFLKRNDFLVGISLDGPPALHDRYRRTLNGNPTASRVLASLQHLVREGVELNILTCVHAGNVGYPIEVYRYIKSVGARFIQLIPIVVRSSTTSSTINPMSVQPKQYGQFLIEVFDEWIKHDLGQVFVQIFESTFSSIARGIPSICLFSEVCGNAVVVEHNGDVFSCDHFVEPAHRLGNILESSFREMLSSEKQLSFGLIKKYKLADECLDCEVLDLCHGGCPKNRFPIGPQIKDSPNYLCGDYKLFFTHVKPVMTRMLEAFAIQSELTGE
jgi:uncharacterized protein